MPKPQWAGIGVVLMLCGGSGILLGLLLQFAGYELVGPWPLASFVMVSAGLVITMISDTEP